jgi:hypothetical protein
VQDLADRYFAARRKCWLRSRPVLDRCVVPSDREVSVLEKKLGRHIPPDKRSWLAFVGCCNVDDDLSFRTEWFRRIDRGHLRHALLSAQGTPGNFYGLSLPKGQRIFLPLCARICPFRGWLLSVP